MTQFGVVLFFTTSSVLQAEKALKNAGLPVKLIPTPRQLSSDCGIALRFDWQHLDAVVLTGKSAGLDFASVHNLNETP